MSKAAHSFSVGLLPFLVLFGATSGCTKEDKPKSDTPPPPPSAVSAKPGACAGGGGEVADAISAPFFPRTVADYCVDPQGDVKTYGDRGKLSIEQVCTMAFDGECEIYKRFGLTRVVSLHYVDGSGKGGTVEVTLSQFKEAAGAYGMYTLRVVTNERDPADPTTPKPLAAGAAAASGKGSAYVYRGQHFVELQYNNENESPDQIAKSSAPVLAAVAKEIGAKLPGPATLPPSAQLLPEAGRLPNAVLFQPKDAFEWKGVGPVAIGFYKDGDKRWRDLAIVKDDVEQAKDAFKTIKSTPGALPVPNVGDEAAYVVVPTGEKGSGPKVEILVARKGNVVWGVGDEEYALRASKDQAKARVSKEEALAKIRPLLATPGAGAPPASAAPSAPKK